MAADTARDYLLRAAKLGRYAAKRGASPRHDGYWAPEASNGTRK
jgi:hypothetical protein